MTVHGTPQFRQCCPPDILHELVSSDYYGLGYQTGSKNLTRINNHICAVQFAGEQIGADQNLLSVHDISKFSRHEFRQYGLKYIRYDDNDEHWFPAWIHHISHNPHHPEHWVAPGLRKNKTVPMPYFYVFEMVADWLGAEYSNSGNWNMSDWLNENLDKLLIHTITASRLYQLLSDIGYRVEAQILTKRSYDSD